MQAWIFNIILIFVCMSFLWAYAQRIGNNSVVDIFWGSGFVLIAWASLIARGTFHGRPLLITVLITIWGLRLSCYIWSRNKGQGEDFRYKAMKRSWGDRASIHALFKVFYLQGLLMLIVSLPVQLTIFKDSGDPLTWLDGIGIFIWLFGFSYEAISDRQLMHFKADPKNKGKIMTSGLWATSRHPNYFGEIVLWWGIFLIACQVDFGWISILGTLTITLLIMRVSGVPLLEKRYARDDAYREYADSTPKLFPKLF